MDTNDERCPTMCQVTNEPNPMTDLPAARTTYIQKLNDLLDEGQTNEQTFRSDFQVFLEDGLGVRCRNESVRLECGTPDIQVYQRRKLVGFVENKRPDLDLEAIHRDSELASPATRNGRQLQRYRAVLHNLLLTNHRSVIWYVQGDRIESANLGDPARSDPILKQFVQQELPPIKNPSVLVSRMADLARMLRDNLRGALSNTSPDGLRTQLHQAQEFLDQDLDEDGFADMMAQTIAYGLFAARVHEPDRPLIWAVTPELVPVTNPFLQDMLDDLSSMRVRRAARRREENWSGHIHLLIDLLNGTDIRACLEGFGTGSGSTDPVIYFYEHFLTQYDPEQRRRYGVYYTPDPVVDFIVRSVDEILREKFGLTDGLADRSRINRSDADKPDREEAGAHRVHILDPACGTGSFLYRVVERVRRSLAANQGVWQDYVREDLLPRIHGFEFKMAPHTVAHIKMAWQLQALDLPTDERKAWEVDLDNRDMARFGIYLTNSLDLDPPGAAQRALDLALANEAAAAGRVKSEVPVMVVLGNPPYKGESVNPSRTPEGKLKPIGKLIDDYNTVDGTPLGEANPKWLQDDYVKFIRAAQDRIERTGSGIVAFITNHRFLNAVTFRGMRSSLMGTFDDLYFLNLHGNLRTGSPSVNGDRDENVFSDVQAGVCISFMVKLPQSTRRCRVHYAEVQGARQHQFNTLSGSSWATSEWRDLKAAAPSFWFVPRTTSHESEYRRGFSLRTIFPIQSSGIATARDDLVVNFTLDECRSRLERFRDLEQEQARTEFNLRQDTRDWQVRRAQVDLKNHKGSQHLFQRYLYRPFDWRYTAYTGQSRGIQCMPRTQVMQHMEAGNQVANTGLLFCRQMSQAAGEWRLIGITDCPADLAVLSTKTSEVATVAPLYTVPSMSLYCKENGGEEDPAILVPNLDADFIKELEARIGMNFDGRGSGDSKTSFNPEHCLNYIYGVLHSSAYRERYEHLLRSDYPTLPWPGSADIFLSLAATGGELVRLHLLDPSILTGPKPTYPVSGSNRVDAGYPEYDSATKRVCINEQQYFEGVSPLAWEMQIGSHQPLRKWLQDRRARVLTYGELQHYPVVVQALTQSLDTLDTIDNIVGDGESLWLEANGEPAQP